MTDDAGTKRRGRPSTGKRGTFTFRVTDQLRKRLEKSAQQYRRPVSEEIEFRLENSFAEQDALERMFGCSAALYLGTVLGQAMRVVRAHATKRGWNEVETRKAILAAVNKVAEVHLATSRNIDLPSTLFLEFNPRPLLKPKDAGETIAVHTMQFNNDQRLDELPNLTGTDLLKHWS